MGTIIANNRVVTPWPHIAQFEEIRFDGDRMIRLVEYWDCSTLPPVRIDNPWSRSYGHQQVTIVAA